MRFWATLNLKVLLKVYLLMWICEQPQKREQFPLLLLCKTEFSIQCIFLQNVTMVGTLLGSFDINKKSLWNTHFTRHCFERSEQFSTEKSFLALKFKFMLIFWGRIFFIKLYCKTIKLFPFILLGFIQGHPDEMTQKIIICTI